MSIIKYIRFCNIMTKQQIPFNTSNKINNCKNQLRMYKQLSKQVNYHHDIDAYQQNPKTRQIQRQTLKKLPQYRIKNRPQSLSSVHQSRPSSLYNKWYINPELQYKAQTMNPKNDKKMLSDEEHVYRNLRNPEFWNWVHPFQAGRMPALQTPSNLDKIDGKVLEGFKKFINQSPGKKRLPSIIQHILAEKKKIKKVEDKE